MLDQNIHPLSLSNLMRPEVRADPYPLYHQMRAEDPVHWDEPMGFWALTGYADIVSSLHDPRFSKAQGMETALNRLPEGERENARPVYRFFSKQMLYADPPYHTHLRRLANKAFTPRLVEQMRPQIQQIVDELLDAVQEQGRMDVIHDLAHPLPVTVILDMLGLPPQERRQFKKWSDDFMAVLGLVSRAPELFEQARKSFTEAAGYINDSYERLRKNPGNDLLSALVLAADQGDKLSLEELAANSLLLLAAGHETTTNLIGNGLLALLRHPEQMQQLRDDPSLIEAAVEELMRYDNPVQIMWRMATEEIEIGGKRIGKGELVNLVVGAANRDPAQFPEPDRLKLTRFRSDGRHMGFGLGTHFCLGAPLARLEGQIAIETVLRRLSTLRLEDQSLEWLENPIFHGLKSLSVTF